MSASCYCHSHKPKMPLKKPPTRTELDAALNELGMLSTVTNSRQQYLEEKMISRSCRKEEKGEVLSDSVSGPSLCILQKFVTNFTFSNSTLLLSNGEQDLDAVETTSHELGRFGIKRAAISLSRRAKRHLLRVMPYNLPLKPKIKVLSEDTLTTLFTSSDATRKPLASNSISRQDSGNKSNPSSPVKSQNSIGSSGCSIVRSRSLDDLEISNLSLSDCCGNEAGKADIDTVSQRISNLHVS